MFNKSDEAPMHDPLVVFYLLRPDTFELKYYNVEVETESELCLGRTLIDIYAFTKRKPNVYVVTNFTGKEFFWKTMN